MSRNDIFQYWGEILFKKCRLSDNENTLNCRQFKKNCFENVFVVSDLIIFWVWDLSNLVQSCPAFLGRQDSNFITVFNTNLAVVEIPNSYIHGSCPSCRPLGQESSTNEATTNDSLLSCFQTVFDTSRLVFSKIMKFVSFLTRTLF